jgi:5-methylcytosine-specific restriction endonuclease McrA
MPVTYKEHPDYPGYYAGSDGEIYSSYKGKIICRDKTSLRKLSAGVCGSGYLQVNIKDKNGKRLMRMNHKIVAECFLKNGFDRTLTVSHKNGRKQDNRPENLVMETLSENHKRKYSHGTHDRGYKNSRALINKNQLKQIRRLLNKGEKHKMIAQRFNVNRIFITKINTGDRYRDL